MIKRILAIICLPILAISCKKNGSSPTPTPTPSYFSMTAGNTWNYKRTTNPSTTPVSTNYTLTSTSRDSVAGTRSYHVFTNSAGPNEYYAASGTDYYNYTIFNLPGGTSSVQAENLYLKSASALNTTWDQNLPPITVSGITANLMLSDTIKEKGLTKVVNGITYTDVIHVSSGLKIISTSPPLAGITSALTSNIHNYYAPKYGMISSYTKIDLVYNPGGGFPAINQSNETQIELQSAVVN